MKSFLVLQLLRIRALYVQDRLVTVILVLAGSVVVVVAIVRSISIVHIGLMITYSDRE